MTQSDKDFITRIQVSQLVVQDPYAEDFYAQVFGAISRARAGAAAANQHAPSIAQMPGGPGGTLVGGPGNGPRTNGGQNNNNQKSNLTRRENAMNRMEKQVERIVALGRARELEREKEAIAKGGGKVGAGTVSLQGALGKISLRNARNPRQMVQVGGGDAKAAEGEAGRQSALAAAEGAAALVGGGGDMSGQPMSRPPLTRRAALIALEKVFDIILRLEQMRRVQPFPVPLPARSATGEIVNPEINKAVEEENERRGAESATWTIEYEKVRAEMWSGMMVMEPLEIRCVSFLPSIAIMQC